MPVTELPEAIRETLEPRVTDGVLFFDHKRPGWATLVDLTRLAMAHPCLCVLGHVVGLAHVVDLPLEGVWNAACSVFDIDNVFGQDATLGLNADAPELLGDDADAMAFADGYDDTEAWLIDVSRLELAALQDVWVKVIAGRQGTAAGLAGRALAARWAAL